MQTLLPLLLLLLHFILCIILTQSCIITTNEKGFKYVETITVSQKGDGNFAKIQDAIDSIPSGNNIWIRVYVYPGVYWEQVIIPYDKECIVLEGKSREDTKIVNDAHTQTDTSSTFISFADNFVAKNIGFTNAYNNNGGEGKVRMGEVKQAVAASVYGDKSAFYNCGFVGYQDTLWDVFGRHFYKSCYIEGAVDFIWGNGQSFFEDCTIKVCGDGYITAQDRSSPDDPSGFVFNRGTIYGNGSTYLGRALGPYSRVIYQHTQFSDVINPLGWDARDLIGHEGNFTYAELKCTGGGADWSGRVSWMKKLEKQSEISKYTRHIFIDQDTWINQQP